MSRALVGSGRGSLARTEGAGPAGAAPLTVAALALCAGGCIERLVDFRVRELVALRATAIDDSGFDLRVRMRIENPNRLSAEVRDLRFVAFVGEHRIGAGSLAGPFAAPADASFELEAPVRVSYGDLPADFPARVKGGELELRTEARFRARTSLGDYAMRLESESRTRIAPALEVAVQGSFGGRALSVENVRLAGVELRRVRLRVRLRARNHFAFPITVRGGEFRLAINDQHFGESKLERPLALSPRGQAVAELAIAASHGVVGDVVVGMFGKEPQFRVRGHVEIAPIGGVSRIPIDVRAGSSVFGAGD
jgi:LEA14-like dessication related protein